MGKTYRFNPFIGNFDETVVNAAFTDEANSYSTTQTFKTPTSASLGAELITVAADRTMETGASWTGTDWSLSANTFLHSPAGINAATLPGYAATIGKRYLITISIARTSSTGYVAVSYGGVSSPNYEGGVNTSSFVVTAIYALGLVVTPSATWLGSFDTVSIKELTVSTSAFNTLDSTSTLSSESRANLNDNFGLGLNALSSTQSGISNLAFGNNALRDIITGSDNTAFGVNALTKATTPDGNTAIGSNTLSKNLYGAGNVAIGKSALRLNVTGASNTAIGTLSLENNTSGLQNVAIGLESLRNNTSGYQNVAIGTYALFTNITGTGNVAIGSYALMYGLYNSNVAIGDSSLRNCVGTGNVGIGANTLSAASTVDNNTAIGNNAMQKNTTGNMCTALGSNSLNSNLGGGNNTALGYFSMYTNASGYFNTGIGSNVLYKNLSGYRNTSIGTNSLYNNSTGFSNTAVGEGAGYTSTGNNNVYLGAYAGRYNTGSGKFYIDAFDRTNTAGDDAGAIVTGTMDATPANQTLKFNAAVTSGISHSSPIFNVTNGAQKSAITRSATAADYALALPDSSGTFALIDAAQTFTALQDFSGGIGSTAGMTTINGYTRLLSPTQSAVAAGNITFDASAQHIFYATGGTGTWTLSNMSEGQTVTILATAVTGTITWATATIWPGAVVPTPTATTANRYDIYTFTKIGGLLIGSALLNVG